LLTTTATSYLSVIREAAMTGQSPSFSMRGILWQDRSGGVCASASSVHWRTEVGARAGRGVAHPSAGKCLDDFHGVTANFARIDLYACNNTNPQKWAGP
jgi:hypothetical protein